MIVITPDKGLTGPLNSNILRRASRFILNEAGAPVRVIDGRQEGPRLHDPHAARCDRGVHRDSATPSRSTTCGRSPRSPSTTSSAGKVDAVYVVYRAFVNTLTQVPEVRQILPIDRPEGDRRVHRLHLRAEPGAVLKSLLPRYVEIQLYQAILEAIASEHSARMVAMRNASRQRQGSRRTI